MDDALSEAPIEEHFILRLPPKLADKLAPFVKQRNVPADLEICFTGNQITNPDNRTATFKWRAENVSLPASLVVRIIVSIESLHS